MKEGYGRVITEIPREVLMNALKRVNDNTFLLVEEGNDFILVGESEVISND